MTTRTSPAACGNQLQRRRDAGEQLVQSLPALVTRLPAWQEAVQLYREQGHHDDAARVQHNLDNLNRNGDQVPQETETTT